MPIHAVRGLHDPILLSSDSVRVVEKGRCVTPERFKASLENLQIEPEYEEALFRWTEDLRGLPDWLDPNGSIQEPVEYSPDIRPIVGVGLPNGNLDDEANPLESEDDSSKQTSPIRSVTKEIGETGADALAVYRPYHLFGKRWGIYFHAENLWSYAAEIAGQSKNNIETVWPFVFHQVYRHELSHFQIEATATDIELVLHASGMTPRPAISSPSLYIEYLNYRYRLPTYWSPDGLLEEAFATWEEYQFVLGGTSPAWLPDGYVEAVLGAHLGAGYACWPVFQNPRERKLAIQQLLLNVAGIPWNAVDEPFRPPASAAVRVPLYLVGNPDIFRGSLRKDVANPTIRVFEKWLRRNGMEPTSSGNGSHRAFAFKGKRQTYGTSSGIFSGPEVKQAADLLGFPNQREFLRAIRDGANFT